MSYVLLVDDDESAVLSLSRALASLIPDVALLVATDGVRALAQAANHEPEVAVVDLSLNNEEGVESGFALLKDLGRLHPYLRVIVLTGHGDSAFGIRAMKLGAANFLTKPADLPHLAALVVEARRQFQLAKSMAERDESDQVRILNEGLIGSSLAIQQLKEQIRFAASNSQPVLLDGETGVGKSLCARLIHQLGKRAQAPFVRYQPGLSRSDVLASELFGHEKGAFTGAEQSRAGLVRKAHGGTFFLDEVDGLPLETQIALLGLLQERKYRRLGADEEEEVDIRFLTATNADIDVLLQNKELRSDFFHRISHSRIRIPPLRDRLEDISDLVCSIIERLQREEEVSYVEFCDDACSVLRKYDWPGNVRELEGVVQGACLRVLFAGRTEIHADDVKIGVETSQKAVTKSGETLQEQVSAFKRERVQSALSLHEGNQVQAAKSLGIDRTTLRRILQS
ncbi:MAG: sigma-54-dependent Fis family transcriptional regulator [Bdellovibrionales bacterium]|nr:sigma-54-dependent Fis family transcriptional regulator [Bdellovibrionales bacterium]